MVFFCGLFNEFKKVGAFLVCSKLLLSLNKDM